MDVSVAYIICFHARRLEYSFTLRFDHSISNRLCAAAEQFAISFWFPSIIRSKFGASSSCSIVSPLDSLLTLPSVFSLLYSSAFFSGNAGGGGCPPTPFFSFFFFFFTIFF